MIGSTDHHNASPGSHGFGRTLLWAEDLSRDSVWNALLDRFTSCATGDPIQVMLFVDDRRMGECIPEKSASRRVEGFVAAFDKLEKVELVKNGKVIAGEYDFKPKKDDRSGFVSCMFGWGKKHMPCIWDIRIEVKNGKLISASPRLRGVDMVGPLDAPKNANDVPLFSVSDSVTMHFTTDGNPTAVTDTSQGCVIEMEGEDAILSLHVEAEWGGEKIERKFSYSIEDLKAGQNTEYIDGFVSPAIEIGQYRSSSECTCHIAYDMILDEGDSAYLRAYEKNGDGVYSSPLTVRV